MSNTPSTVSMSPTTFLRHAFRLMVPYKPALILFFMTVITQVAFYLCLPVFYREVFDQVIPNQDLAYLTQITITLCVLFVIFGFSESMEAYITSRMASNVMRDVRQNMFKHIQKLPTHFFANTSTGDILSRFTNDLAMVEQALLSSFYKVCFHTLAIITGISILFIFEWRLALITLLSFPLGIIGPKLLSPKASKAGTTRKEEDANTMSAIQENLLAQRVIRAFALQTAYIEKFAIRLGNLHARSLDLHRTTLFINKTSSVGVLILQLIVLLGGAFLAVKGYLTGGILVSFLAILSGIGNSARALTGTASELVQAAAGLQRVHAFLNEPIEPNSEKRTTPLPTFQDQIRFEDVTFSYTGDEPNLQNVSFTIPAGQSVAFVGRSGSGKSTVLNLITRFYETNEGAIVIDGNDLSQVAEEGLRAQISPVFQDTFLFNTTICENIRQGRLNATDEEVEQAAESAEIHDFICSLPQGYDTPVGEMGGHLSGGQRQRLSLARAILRNPTILVLDEATSSLDPATEAAINATLEKLAENCTMIAVTHRLTSAVNLDQIFVMDQGQLAEQGTHRELLNKKGLYYDMWQDFTLELTQDVVVGEITSETSDIQSIDLNLSPEALAEKVRELQSQLYQDKKELDRLREINLRWAQLAGTDRLTGLPNKLSFLQAIVLQEIQQAQYNDDPIGFMLISGDNLGPINEQYGRDAGDMVIGSLAKALQSELKGEEQLGHLDGTNFAVSLHPATLEDTKKRAEELRAFVANHPFHLADTQINITASVGITAFNSTEIDDTRQATEDTFNALNQALYDAKRAGGDRVESV
ncbi:MAG: ATP-binding cassette domain-containing protein [Candidatus Latescibacteria bacterium]|nr:ATP-binding cassette domain-containing protein [Candidatus Latescibacterota bacterium]